MIVGEEEEESTAPEIDYGSGYTAAQIAQMRSEQEKKINLDELTIVSGNKIRPTASIKMNIEDKEVIEADVGIGPVDAAINAVNKGIKNFADIKLEEYHVDAITGGTDALIEVIIKLSSGDKIISARATEPDIINASVEAYLDGVNRLLDLE